MEPSRQNPLQWKTCKECRVSFGTPESAWQRSTLQCVQSASIPCYFHGSSGGGVGHHLPHKSEMLNCKIRDYGNFETGLSRKVLEESNVCATSVSLGGCLRPGFRSSDILFFIPGTRANTNVSSCQKYFWRLNKVCTEATSY